MGNIDVIKKLYKFGMLSIKHTIMANTSSMLSYLYIAVPREYLRDEVVLAATKTSQKAYKIRREMNELSEEISNYLDGV